MGFFGNLFNKKNCSICGGEIGLLGNRKLEDGNLCKNCASKLSPYYSDRRHSTVEEISAHLAYRAENLNNLAYFNPTRAEGERTKVYVDEANGKFIVSAYSDWRSGNPDILDTSAVLECRVKPIEHKRELWDRTPDGKQVRFNPPRFEFSYEFYVTIVLNNPWIDEIGFELTDRRPDSPDSELYIDYEVMANRLQNALRPDLYPIIPRRPRPIIINRPIHPEPRRPEPKRPEPVRPANEQLERNERMPENRNSAVQQQPVNIPPRGAGRNKN